MQNEYSKAHYKNIGIKIKEKNADIIEKFSKDLHMSKAELIQKCVLYCYENMIDISNVTIE